MDFYLPVKSIPELIKHPGLYMRVIIDMFSLTPINITVLRYSGVTGLNRKVIPKLLAKWGVRIEKGRSRAPGKFVLSKPYQGIDPTKHPNVILDYESGQRRDNGGTTAGQRRDNKNACPPMDSGMGGTTAGQQRDNGGTTAGQRSYIKVSKNNKQKTINKKKARARKRGLPEGFGWSDRLEAWATDKHPAIPIARFREYMEAVFIPQNLAKDYGYRDHERAFMVWVAKELRQSDGWFSADPRARHRTTSREAVEERRREKFERFRKLAEASDARE